MNVMKKKIIFALTILITFSFALGGCDDSWLDESDEAEAQVEELNIEPVEIGSDARSATILVYMNGSDLETEGGMASADISEMIASGIGDNVNVIIQTMGTKSWQEYGIS